ncbi:MAG TPA: hypothetical protein PKN32_08905 [Bacteroidales bacterium]|nr:hypothetical protein [Bacteroidales bacterium]
MKTLTFAILVLSAIMFFGCEKESQENDNNNSKSFYELYSFGYDKEVLLDKTDNLVAGETIWYEFEASANEIYNISWYDAILTMEEESDEPDPEYATIKVSAYHQNKTDAYFANYRLIQMTGSDQTIIPSTDETIFIKIEAYDSDRTGKFDFNVDHLVFNNSKSMLISEKTEFTMSAGDTKIFFIEGEKDSIYNVYCNQINEGVALSDQIEVKASNYFKNSEGLLVGPIYCREKTFSITATEDGRIYFVFNGPYWWQPATMEIEPLFE